MLAKVVEHVEEILPDVVRQHEAVVQRRAPAHEAAVERALPQPGDEGAHQQLLGKAHARIGRHLEAAELDQAEPAGRTVRREQLVDADLRAMRVAGDVDQQIAEQPVDQPGQRCGTLVGVRHLRHRDLQLVEAVVAGLVEARRLAGRADEQAGEQIGQRRMALPLQHQALQQVGTAQERAVVGRRAADHDVVAAAGAGVAAVDHELVGAEPRLPRLLVDRRRGGDAIGPVRGRMDVDLDDARDRARRG